MKEIRLSPEAINDLASIRRYTRTAWGPVQADRYLKGLGDLFREIAAGGARLRPAGDIRAGYLRARYGPHVVFLTQDDIAVRIVRILHSRMDFESYL